MAKNLDQILTSYTAVGVTVDHPISGSDSPPRSGDPCRYGTLVGVALVDEQFGYDPGGARELHGFHLNKPFDPINSKRYENGETPVSFQQNIWWMNVYNNDTSPATPGTRVYYNDSAAGTHIWTDGTGADAVAGIIMREEVPPQQTKRVPVMLTPGATL